MRREGIIEGLKKKIVELHSTVNKCQKYKEEINNLEKEIKIKNKKIGL
jgi:hypothetical protein